MTCSFVFSFYFRCVSVLFILRLNFFLISVVVVVVFSYHLFHLLIHLSIYIFICLSLTFFLVYVDFFPPCNFFPLLPLRFCSFIHTEPYSTYALLNLLVYISRTVLHVDSIFLHILPTLDHYHNSVMVIGYLCLHQGT